MLRVTSAVDLADWADIPLTVDTDVFEIVAFKACLSVARMIAREGSIHRYAMDGPSGVNFMAEFCMLEG